MKRLQITLVALLAIVLVPAALFASPIAIDDFEDGTTQGWFVPGGGPLGSHPAPPANVLGGQGGALDNYLLLTALGGGGSGSRMSVLNESQWTGNFAGITGIDMDVNNFGPDSLFLRLLFVNFPPGGPPLGPTDVAWTLAPIIVPSGSGWTHISFDLSPSNLFAPFGTAGALSDVNELRLFHSVAPFFGGPGVGSEPVVARLGVDNIAAAAVPEPTSLLLLSTGGLGLLATMRRRKKQNPTNV
jgi:hypothetical protein